MVSHNSSLIFAAVQAGGVAVVAAVSRVALAYVKLQLPLRTGLFLYYCRRERGGHFRLWPLPSIFLFNVVFMTLTDKHQTIGDDVVRVDTTVFT